jgi:hypothetical protein
MMNKNLAYCLEELRLIIEDVELASSLIPRLQTVRDKLELLAVEMEEAVEN